MQFRKKGAKNSVKINFLLKVWSKAWYKYPAQLGYMYSRQVDLVELTNNFIFM